MWNILLPLIEIPVFAAAALTTAIPGLRPLVHDYAVAMACLGTVLLIFAPVAVLTLRNLPLKWRATTLALRAACVLPAAVSFDPWAAVFMGYAYGVTTFLYASAPSQTPAGLE